MAKSALQLKLEKEAEAERLWQVRLAASNVYVKQKRDEKRNKKKTIEALMKQVEYGNIADNMIRGLDEYKPKSYNPERQIVDLLKHMFVKYNVPSFMYQCLIRNKEIQASDRHAWDDPDYRNREIERRASLKNKFFFMDDLFREWFIVIAQGGSFQKKVKDLMSKKEAVYFLTRGKNDISIVENIWWAKLMCAGFEKGIAEKLLERIFKDHFPDDPDGRLAELMNFFLHHHKNMGRDEFSSICDFVRNKLMADRQFRFKGRTLSSMIKLSNEWHMLQIKAKLGSNVKWPGYEHPVWFKVTNKHLFEVVELTNNKDLLNEGRKQHHCVYSYVRACAEGRCSIFSLRIYQRKNHALSLDEANYNVFKGSEESRITMEVSRANDSVVQIRGSFNRGATVHEMEAIKFWSGEKGFRIVSRRW